MSPWPDVPLGLLMADGGLRNGLSPSRTGAVPGTVLTLSALTRGRYDPTARKQAMFDKEPDPTQLARAGTFLICRGNGNVKLVGAGCFATCVANPPIFPDTVIGGAVNEGRVHPRYLEFAWALPRTREQIERAARTTNGTHKVNQEALSAITVPLPPLPEQRRIADILDKADAVRRKRAEAIGLVGDLAKSVFLEMFGDPVTNPLGWPESPLHNVAVINSGVAKGKDYGSTPTISVPYMRVANVQDGYLDLSEIKHIDVPKAEAEKYALQVGDVLLTEGGDPDKLGRGTVWRGQIPGCIHQNHIFSVRVTGSVVPEYLSCLIGSERGKRYFLRAGKQTTGIASINKTQLSNFPCLLPPLALQEQFREATLQVSRLDERLANARRTADDLFDSLVHRAFNGEL